MRILLSFLLLATTTTAFAVEPVYLELLSGTQYELAWNADHSLTARAVVRASKDVDPRTLDINVADAAKKGRGDAKLRDALHPRYENGAIVFQIPAVLQIETGTYDVVLLLHPPSKAETQKLSLQLVNPPADLRLPLTIAARRTVWWPFGPALVTSPELELRENGGRSGLTSLTAQRSAPLLHGDDAVSATVGLVPPPAIEPRGTTRAKLTLAGDFPIGTSTTKIDIAAPQLTAPVTVMVQVKTHRPIAFLFGAIALGLLAGYLLRTLLGSSISRGEVRLQAIDLAQRMAAERGSRNDATFNDRIAAAITVLKRAIKGPPAELPAAITAAQAELRAALDDLHQRKLNVLQRLDTLVSIVETDWQIPPDVAKAVDAERDTIAAARRQATSDDADGAVEAERDIRSRLGNSIDNAVQGWATTLRTELDALPFSKPALPPQAAEELKAAADDSRLKLDSLIATPSGDPTATLAAVYGANRGIRWSLTRPLTHVATHAETAAGILTDSGTEGADRVNAALRRFHASFDDVLQVREAMIDLLQTLHTVISAAADPSNAAVTAALNGGDYVNAATELSSAAAAQGILLNRVTTKTMPAPTDTAAEGAAAVLVMRTFATSTSAPVLEPLEALQVRTAWQLFFAKLFRFAIAAVGLTIVGVLMFAPKFEGTITDLASAFLWGYAGDISVDALTEAAKRTR